VTAPTSSAQDSAKEVAQTILVSVPPKPHEVQSISYVEVTGIVCGSKYESDQVIDQFAKTRMVNAQFSQAFCPGKGHMTITISGPYIMA